MDNQQQNSNNNNNPGNGGNSNRPSPNIFNFLIIGFLITFVLNMLFTSTTANKKDQIAYTQFIDLVEAGVVREVQVESDQLLIYVKTDADQEAIRAILSPQAESAAQQGGQSEQDESAGQTAQATVDLEALNKLLNGGSQSITLYTGRLEHDGMVEWLHENGVKVSKPLVQSSPMMDFFSSWIFPIIILYAIYFLIIRFMMKRMGGGSGGGLGGMMGVGKSNAKVYNVEKSTGITFNDVAGQDEAKESLDEMVDFLHSPGKYQKIGAKQPRGALLVGPPGTGKTLLAKAVAGEAKVPFFSLSGSEFVEMFVGVGAKRVRDLFEQAQKQAPCIIFIDEIDAIGKSRDNQLGSNDEREQTLNQLLAEMDGFDGTKGIVVLAATNRPEILDKALLRPGRFDRQIIVEKPDLPGRESILKVHAKKVSMGPDVNLKEIALATSGATGADLANMINEAALRAVRMGRQAVIQEDMMESVELVIAGKEKKDRIMNKKEKELVAFHEVGHALASALQKNSTPVQKITIVPRTMGSLGYTMNMPEEERYLMTKDELLAQIVTLLAGRAAEEVQFGSASTGAANDIERATSLARKMVTQYGMSEKFGMMALETTQSKYLDGRNVSTVSDSTGAGVDDEVRGIIDSCHAEATKLLEDNKEKLAEIAQYLIEKETITGLEFMKILKGPDYVEPEKDADGKPLPAKAAIPLGPSTAAPEENSAPQPDVASGESITAPQPEHEEEPT